MNILSQNYNNLLKNIFLILITKDRPILLNIKPQFNLNLN